MLGFIQNVACGICTELFVFYAAHLIDYIKEKNACASKRSTNDKKRGG